ncbi:MAG: hypothetical protein ACJ71E_05130 [Nitrososphaeraceae archaeon]
MCRKDAIIRDDYDTKNENGHRLEDSPISDIIVDRSMEHALFLTHQTVH